MDSPSSTSLVGDLHKDIKIKAPEKYGGERSKLKGFLIQIDLYFTLPSTPLGSSPRRKGSCMSHPFWRRMPLTGSKDSLWTI
jgi:hypothetical protein